MHNLDTINRGNHIKSYDFPEESYSDYYEDYYELLDFEEDEIEYN
jgi:hypothetical protein